MASGMPTNARSRPNGPRLPGPDAQACRAGRNDDAVTGGIAGATEGTVMGHGARIRAGIRVGIVRRAGLRAERRLLLPSSAPVSGTSHASAVGPRPAFEGGAKGQPMYP